MLARDHYATLGVSPNADAEQVELAYRHLSRRYHPDINPGDPHAATVFERIVSAYEVLSDPERRARYDSNDSPADSISPAASDLLVRILPEGNEPGTYGDLFRHLKDHRERSGSQRGSDLYVDVSVALVDSERGRKTTARVSRHDRCESCSGRGRVQLQRSRPCESCSGSGQETFVKGALSVTCRCADCDGSGLLRGIPCSHCAGQGLHLHAEMILVRVPPGIIDGQEIRISGQGHCGRLGGERGDLVLRCHIEPAGGFSREGPHLHVSQPISALEAVLGGRIEVATLDGQQAGLPLPPNTQTGQVFRLRGRGLELPDGRRGDMLVRVEVHLPRILDEDSKEMIRQLAARHPFNPRNREAEP